MTKILWILISQSFPFEISKLFLIKLQKIIIRRTMIIDIFVKTNFFYV